MSKNTNDYYSNNEKNLRMNCKWCNREITTDEFCDYTCKEKFNKYQTTTQKNLKWFWIAIICCFMLYILIRNIVPLSIIPLNIDSSCFTAIIGLIIIIVPFQSKQRIKKIGAVRAVKRAQIIGSVLIGFAVIVLFIFPR